jgi:hypothetical protein
MVIRSSGSSVLSSPERPLVSSLPERPSLESLRNQAKTLQRRHRDGEPEALERVSRVLEAPVVPLALHDAQFVLARQYGFPSWPKLVEHVRGPRPNRRVRAENGRVWIDGVARLRWGSSAEPTYIGALEAAFRGSERPLDTTTLLGDSGLGFRLRWATRAGDNAWCGSGPCGEWPEEVAALNAATGYVFRWQSDGPDRSAPELIERIIEHIDRGYPILGFATHTDMAVFFGYADDGQRVLVSDYWASEEPSVMRTAEAKEIGMFLERIEAPAPRADAVRDGLRLAVRRWREGVVDPDPISGATYHYGSAAYRRWIGDLERVSSLTAEQRASLFFLNGWTYSSLHMNRSQHAARYLRSNAEHVPEAARPHLEAAAQCYDHMSERLGKWDTASPRFGFVKQKRIDTWTSEVQKDEIALLTSLHELDARAMDAIERAVGDAA